VRCFVVAGFLLTTASRGPSAIAEPLVTIYYSSNVYVEVYLSWWQKVIFDLNIEILLIDEYRRLFDDLRSLTYVKTKFPQVASSHCTLML